MSIFQGAEVGAEPLHPDDVFNPFGKTGGWQAFIKRGELGAPDFHYGWGQGLTEADAVSAAATNYKLDIGRAAARQRAVTPSPSTHGERRE